MSIKAIRDWRLINSRPLFNILAELNKLRKENKELKLEVNKLKMLLEDGVLKIGPNRTMQKTLLR